VDSAELLEGLTGEILDGLLIADIGLDADHVEFALTELGDGGFEGRCFDVGEDDAHAFLSEAFSERASHAGGGSGDDSYFALKLLHHAPPSARGC
jgi:hypothetical protein